jgi:hypothetical protein
MNSAPTVSHEEIAQRAHQIWREAGEPDGDGAAHWLQAERELNAHHAKAAGEAAARAKPAVSHVARHAPEKAPHSANYTHPGVTTDSLHHQRNR